MNQGIIALDIDGTVTDRDHAIPREVEGYLRDLVTRGWHIIFITGRTFSYGWEVLQVCEFPFFYSVYNGAATLRMPEKEIVRRHELDGAMIEALCGEMEPLIHTNVDRGDACYWRPSRHGAQQQAYLRHRRDQTSEPWVEVEEFPELESFAYAKVFDRRERLEELAAGLPEAMASSVIHDPLREGYAVLLITHELATKGGALRDFREVVGAGLPVIAAGDDFNDIPLLAEADVRIAMATGPIQLTQMATIVAPPSSEHGIIPALEAAIKTLSRLD